MIKESEDQISVITKDKAYIAAGQILESMKKIRGRQNQKYLEENFSEVWGEHDKNNKNYMNMETGYQFMLDLIDQ